MIWQESDVTFVYNVALFFHTLHLDPSMKMLGPNLDLQPLRLSDFGASLILNHSVNPQ